MEWMILPLKKYAQFSGRARPKEFWMFVVFNILVGIVAGILDLMLGFGSASSSYGNGAAAASFHSSGPVQIIATLALLVPNIAVAVRRLHDTDRSGWWWWLVLIPLFGWIALLIFYCSSGTNGPNTYGPDPLDDSHDHLAETFN